jgi:tRNA threonylcarbamoyladenosine modification (KEOPS) complex  Pcc1 subunit
MAAGIYNVEIDQGCTWSVSITWNDALGAPINLTGYTAAMQIRESVSSPAVALSLTESSGITLGGSAGTIVITISATQTNALGANFSGVYDLELTGGTIVTRLIQGKVTVSAGVTQ